MRKHDLAQRQFKLSFVAKSQPVPAKKAMQIATAFRGF
jgi:hypothetical protein